MIALTQTRIRSAAMRARKLYPGPVGDVLAIELNSYADLSFLWASATTATRMAALVDHLLRAPLPDTGGRVAA